MRALARQRVRCLPAFEKLRLTQNQQNRLRQPFHHFKIAVVKRKRLRREDLQQSHHITLISDRRRHDRADPEPRAGFRSTRGSISVSSQRSALPPRMHSPENPDCASTRVPSGGRAFPTLARHIIGPRSISAMAAPVPRKRVRARSLITRSALFRSGPSVLNSYWIVVETGVGPGISAVPAGVSQPKPSASKLTDRGLLPPLPGDLPALGPGTRSR